MVHSVAFWPLYLWCGISDMIDGPLARRLRAENKTGAAIDSIADFVGMVIACGRIVPALAIPSWFWLIIGIIGLSQVFRMCFLYFCKGGWGALHDRANKVVGLILYLSPLALYLANITD